MPTAIFSRILVAEIIEFKFVVDYLRIGRIRAPVVRRVRPGVLPVVHGDAVRFCAFVTALCV